VNIANFALGREKSGARNAIAVVQVDSEVPHAALIELRKVEAITLARTMRFSEAERGRATHSS
jgi:D-3-phosphoglycerate dehydrogenase